MRVLARRRIARIGDLPSYAAIGPLAEFTSRSRIQQEPSPSIGQIIPQTLAQHMSEICGGLGQLGLRWITSHYQPRVWLKPPLSQCCHSPNQRMP
eukprot:3200772-Amphidinium_carterae.1